MKKEPWWNWLEKLNACSEAIEWCAEQKSFKQAWADCERGDWMLWILGNLSGKEGSTKRRKLVLVACKCARLSLKFVPKNEKRPRIAIETAEKWARRVKGIFLDDVSFAAYSEKQSMLKKCADIVRKQYPNPPRKV